MRAGIRTRWIGAVLASFMGIAFAIPVSVSNQAHNAPPAPQCVLEGLVFIADVRWRVLTRAHHH